MPTDIKAKIDWLCSKISTIEWSGILIYDIVGDVRDTETCRIELKDIVPMDKGSTGYTTYKLDPKVVMDHYMTHPEHEDFLIGHIHSHHNMDVFFSGVDTDELHENAPNHNMYLSLIVNNKDETCCKLVFLAEVKEASISFLDKDGEETLTMGNLEPQSKLVVYNCDVIVEKPVITVDTHFLEGVERIMKAKVVPVTYGNTRVGFPNPSLRVGSQTKSRGFQTRKRNEANRGYWNAFENEDFVEDFPEDIDVLAMENAKAHKFVMDCLTLSKVLANETDIGGIADAMATAFPTMSIPKVLQNVGDKFFTVYGQVYPQDTDYDDIDINMSDVLSAVGEGKLEVTTHRGILVLEGFERLIQDIVKQLDNE